MDATRIVVKTGNHPLEQGLLNQAIGFVNAASRCDSEVLITPLVSNRPLTVAVVCYAFAIELYLKLLCVIGTGEHPRQHELDKLLLALTPSARAALDAYAKPLDAAAAVAALGKSFTEWRYAHEHEQLSANISDLKALAAACHRAARQLRPDLHVFGENMVMKPTLTPLK